MFETAEGLSSQMRPVVRSVKRKMENGEHAPRRHAQDGVLARIPEEDGQSSGEDEDRAGGRQKENPGETREREDWVATAEEEGRERGGAD